MQNYYYCIWYLFVFTTSVHQLIDRFLQKKSLLKQSCWLLPWQVLIFTCLRQSFKESAPCLHHSQEAFRMWEKDQQTVCSCACNIYLLVVNLRHLRMLIFSYSSFQKKRKKKQKLVSFKCAACWETEFIRWNSQVLYLGWEEQLRQGQLKSEQHPEMTESHQPVCPEQTVPCWNRATLSAVWPAAVTPTTAASLQCSGAGTRGAVTVSLWAQTWMCSIG